MWYPKVTSTSARRRSTLRVRSARRSPVPAMTQPRAIATVARHVSIVGSSPRDVGGASVEVLAAPRAVRIAANFRI
eukprot:scaffold113977_cov28-Tisochrysis_lutea.AAC.10